MCPVLSWNLSIHYYTIIAGSYTPRARTGRSGLEGATSPRMRSPRKRFDVTDARCHMWSPHAKQEQAQAQADAPRPSLGPECTWTAGSLGSGVIKRACLHLDAQAVDLVGS